MKTISFAKSGNFQAGTFLLAILSFALALVFKGGGALSVAVAGVLGVALVFMQKVETLPSLILLCLIGNTVSFMILFAMIVFSFTRLKEIKADKSLHTLFVLLVATLPFFFVLVYQRHSLDGDLWQRAISYSQYYLSFWGFIYFYLIYSLNNVFSAKTLFAILLIVVLLRLIGVGRASIDIGRLNLYAIATLSAYCWLQLLKGKNLTQWLVLFVLSLFLVITIARTFTNLVIFVLSIVLCWAVSKEKLRVVKFFGGYPIYIVWVVLMAYGIMNYTVVSVYSEAEHVDYSSWNSFKSYFSYKLLSDRAPFWDGAFTQLINLKPILPMHDIPDITYISVRGSEGEASFGGHNTYLQLLRVFGLLMGGILIFCYVRMSTLATRALTVERNPYFISVFVASIAYMVAFCLTGTASMLTSSSLIGFGIMGLAYKHYQIINSELKI